LNYILGIDQGGTKTAAAIMNAEGVICGAGSVKGAYYPEDGMDYAMSFIADAVQTAKQQAGIKAEDIDCVVAGITGQDWPEDAPPLKIAVRKITQVQNVKVCNDCLIAMYGGTRNVSGAILCAGTGLNGAVISPDGNPFVLGDYIEDGMQGGSALARRALRKVFDAQLGFCPSTELTKLFMDFSGEHTIDDLLHKSVVNNEFMDSIIHLVPQIVDLAEDGDFVTQQLLDEFADKMSSYMIAALNRTGMLLSQADVVLAGSVFKGEHNRLTAMVKKFIKQSAPNVNIINARYEPVVGACVMGMMQSKKITEQMEQNIEKSSQNLNLIRH